MPATVSVAALAREMFASAAETLGTLVDGNVAAGQPRMETIETSLRIDPSIVATIAEIPAAGAHVVVRYDRDAFTRVVGLMLGTAEGGEPDAMQLSIVSETLSQLTSAMAERMATALGAASEGITTNVPHDAGAFPPPPFERYVCDLTISGQPTPVTIDFDSIALAKLGHKPAAAAAAAQPAPAQNAAASRSAEGRPVAFPTLTPTPSRAPAPGQANLDLVHDVPLEISAVLGQTVLPLREVVSMHAGSVFELDKLASEPIDLYVNNILIARGEVVVVDDRFAVKISELGSGSERTHS